MNERIVMLGPPVKKKIKRLAIFLDEPVKRELDRVRREHHDSGTFNAIILHLICMHDIEQDAKINRAKENAGKRPATLAGQFSPYAHRRDPKLDGTPEGHAEMMAWIKSAREYAGYTPNLKTGRPKGVKDSKPRKPRQKKLALVEVK